ncbi:putative SRR1-like domain-containing protein [Seiridium cardinale]|uniref:SRR1-like domain-containing protein n=1 Tax=Seiridium cardinale TaxID=138064 RepID=A0ABR2XEF9_9PEZI
MGSQDGEEAWTFVTNKRNRQSGKRAPTLAPTTAPAAPQTRTTPNLSVEEIRSDHRKFVQQWVDSKCCNKLKDITQAKSCHPSPTKAVCLGLGSFDPEDGSWQIRRRSHVQLAAFMTFVECVEQLCGRKVRRIFQEPCFTVGDKEFLTSLGHEIVDSPKGFEEISEDSIVFGIHLYRNIYSVAIEKALPAIFIGTGYDVWERYGSRASCTQTRKILVGRECGNYMILAIHFHFQMTKTFIQLSQAPQYTGSGPIKIRQMKFQTL